VPGKPFLPYRRLLDHPPPADPFALRVTRSGIENPRGEFVLYWAQSARRLGRNLALEHAIRTANEARLPVLVYESIRPDYPGANDRIHTFVLEGVRDNAAEAERRGVRYAFFLPRTRDEARGTLRRLAARARLVVTDEYPTFVVQSHTASFLTGSPVAVDLVDGNGILPMRFFEKEQYSAKFLRDRAHRAFPDWWVFPKEESATPFGGELDFEEYDGSDPTGAARACDIDHSLISAPLHGGRRAALDRLSSFIGSGLIGYAEGRNKFPKHVSGLSPFLHFGFIGIHEIAEAVLRSEAPAEDIDSFLEEAIIRRELSFNLCFFRPDHDSLSVLPDWAKKTIDAHRRDRRKPEFSYEQMEAAQTYDEVWNLSQRQLLACGTMHGYLRMLWGKKIIEWSATPEEAHSTMVSLHERYALDGRDPNTHAGVLWCFGKHDRPWFPERPIFGTLRYMSSDSTVRKVRLGEIERIVTECEATARSRAES